jgi:hypothetical protein
MSSASFLNPTNIVAIGGLAVVSYFLLRETRVGNAVNAVADATSSVVSNVSETFTMSQAFNPIRLATNVVNDIQRSTNVGVGTIPTCRSEPIFDKGWDGALWRGLGGGQTTCGICDGGRQNVDGLCYNPCPSGTNRVAGMPYLCR